ncbi:Fez family zinc finger protein 2 [Frankliniella fusca]|uniref:Fez family zinc finger protein 2 n=1 Tax=Frankliniella fusca TaxID=407009 RepID=A0AAE1H0I7_9NEOP|nr:Fez family zinc finger protein 2 [Frankliniella fusca]
MMESAELDHQYEDENVERSESDELADIGTEKMMESATDESYGIDFDKAELLDGEEVVMEGLPNIQDPSEALQVIQCEEDDSGNVLEVDPRHRKVDKDDPRSRLHYIKYLKKEGKPMKMWECGICGKEFRHQYTLMRHLPTHTDERNYKCEDCGKAFRQMSTLSQHRAIHSDARPYVCECCKKTFNRVSTLISHRKTHSDSKPHKCPICFKGFHQKGNLRNHVFTHTNERPYKCEICEKGFNQMSNLVCHKAHVHGDKSRHVCNMCGSEFLRRYALRLHQEYTHGIVYRGSNRVQLKKALEESEESRDEENVPTKKSIRLLNVEKANSTNTSRAKHTGPKQSSRTPSVETKVSPSSEVIIDPIETKAMKNAKDSGQTTFALFKPAKGIPVLVKVMPAPNNKQMLVPATVEDLKSAGKITVSPNYDSANSGSPIKAVQIKVPVVATVIQRVGENGQLTISVESPGPDQSPETIATEEESGLEVLPEESDEEGAVEATPEAEAELMEDGEEIIDQAEEEGEVEGDDEGNVIHFINEDGTVVAMDGTEGAQVQYLQDDGTLMEAQPTVIMHPDATIVSENENEHQTGEYILGDPTGEILQMDTGGEIQLVRAKGDGTYEVISEEEAALLLQNQEQSIEILEDSSDVQFQHMLEGDDGEILVNQGNLSALVSAIRSAGYEVLPGEAEAHQDVKSDEFTLKTEPVQMDLEDGADYL